MGASAASGQLIICRLLSCMLARVAPARVSAFVRRKLQSVFGLIQLCAYIYSTDNYHLEMEVTVICRHREMSAFFFRSRHLGADASQPQRVGTHERRARVDAELRVSILMAEHRAAGVVFRGK